MVGGNVHCEDKDLDKRELIRRPILWELFAGLNGSEHAGLFEIVLR